MSVLEPGQAALIAALLHRLRNAASLQPRLAESLVDRKTAPLQSVSDHVDVEAQLFLHLGVVRRLVERPGQPSQPRADGGHQFGSPSIDCMMATIRSHSRLSTASCFLPAGVSA